MRILVITLVAILLFSSQPAISQTLLSDAEMRAFSNEISGELAKRNLEFISRQHRMRGSQGYLAAAQFIAQELRKYGITDVRIEEFPADGKIFYGTQKSRPPWDAEFAELWELKNNEPQIRIASWDAIPLTLAQDSESADVIADLIDVGTGTSDEDYKGKDVSKKIVLTSEQPESVALYAVEKFGAAGIISYAQNQRTAWWGENENLIRWGHLDTFAKTPTFAFMLSLKQARALQKRLQVGEKISLHATVKAGKHSGNYQVVNAVIPGSDPNLKDKEIVFSCHLDHPRPGANDNASGCATILEVARVFSKLIADKKIKSPARTLRFVWPAEVEGTLALLNGRPELVSHIVSAIHLDMVGGSTETQAIFHITRGPASMPSFIYDVIDSIGEFVNQQTNEFASTGSANFPLYSAEGEKRALQAEFANFSMGSDHEIYADSSFKVPAIYFNDWPDRYIHTNYDTPANIDPTKLTRAAFLAAGSAYYLSNLTQPSESLITMMETASLKRASKVTGNSNPDAVKFQLWYEREVFDSLKTYFNIPDETQTQFSTFIGKIQNLMEPVTPPTQSSGDAAIIFSRSAKLKGPMEVFGYNYLHDHYGSDKTKALRLPELDNGGIYSYEVLNFVDGKRNVQEITSMLSGAYGPISMDVIVEYLKALEAIGVVIRN